MIASSKRHPLHLVWNVDLSITVKCGGRKVFRTTRYFAKDEAESFVKGWFGDQPRNIRWTFVRSKRAA